MGTAKCGFVPATRKEGVPGKFRWMQCVCGVRGSVCGVGDHLYRLEIKQTNLPMSRLVCPGGGFQGSTDSEELANRVTG